MDLPISIAATSYFNMKNTEKKRRDNFILAERLPIKQYYTIFSLHSSNRTDKACSSRSVIHYFLGVHVRKHENGALNVFSDSDIIEI